MKNYEPTKHAFFTEGDSLTEQEHKDSCDINLMIHNARRGAQIRGGSEPIYGYDDMNMDRVALEIQKADLEEKLLNGEKEFTQEELDLFPPDVVKKFGYKLKKQAETPKVTNDDQTTNQPQQSKPKQKAKPESTPSEPTETPDS